MRLFAYSFLDMKVGSYSAPFFVAHEQVALRAAIELANDLTNQIGRHPADFSLMSLGFFDTQTGGLEYMAPQTVCVVSSLVNNQQGAML